MQSIQGNSQIPPESSHIVIQWLGRSRRIWLSRLIEKLPNSVFYLTDSQYVHTCWHDKCQTIIKFLLHMFTISMWIATSVCKIFCHNSGKLFDFEGTYTRSLTNPVRKNYVRLHQVARKEGIYHEKPVQFIDREDWHSYGNGRFQENAVGLRIVEKWSPRYLPVIVTIATVTACPGG